MEESQRNTPGPAERSPLESLFEDLTLELADQNTPLPGPPPPVPTPARPAPTTGTRWEQAFADSALAALEDEGLVSASPLLTDVDVSHRPTVPFEVPPEELQRATPWGDDEPGSQLATVPFILEEVPREALPTVMRAALGAEPVDPFAALERRLECVGPRRPLPTDALPTVRREAYVPEEAKAERR